MIPGVLALVLLVVTANLASMAVVREKELGTLEQLNVTPLRRWELIVGKLLPYGLIAMVDVLLVVAVAVGWFQIPLLGSFLLLLAMSAIYVFSTLALGLFISTISETQQQAMMTSTFFFLTPMLYLSGFIFPIENMPQVIQPVTYLIPLRYFLVIVRGIFLKGIGLDLLWPQALAMSAWGTGDARDSRCCAAASGRLDAQTLSRLPCTRALHGVTARCGERAAHIGCASTRPRCVADRVATRALAIVANGSVRGVSNWHTCRTRSSAVQSLISPRPSKPKSDTPRNRNVWHVACSTIGIVQQLGLPRGGKCRRKGVRGHETSCVRNASRCLLRGGSGDGARAAVRHSGRPAVVVRQPWPARRHRDGVV